MSGLEITKATEITIEYWHAFKGESKHVIRFRADGTYAVATKSSDSTRRIEAWKSAEKSLAADHLKPLQAFCNTPGVRRIFAKTKHESILDGDALTRREAIRETPVSA